MLQSDLSPELNDAEESPNPLSGFPTECPATLRQLWSESLSTSMEAAETLYQSDGKDTIVGSAASEQSLAALRARLERTNGKSSSVSAVESSVAADFRRILISEYPTVPQSDKKIYFAIVRAVWQVIRKARKEIGAADFADWLIVSLRPIRTFGLGVLTAELCAAIYDFWYSMPIRLTKSERNRIEDALAITLAVLPPNEIGAYWDNLQSTSFRLRRAMRSGLKHFGSAHAVPHLLRGLEISTDHEIQAAIVDILEEIAEPASIPMLTQLQRETASTDWTLSRHIGRALRVIERQNRGHQQRVLLRAAEAPPIPDEYLVRPASSTQHNHEQDKKDLLRPQITTEKTD